MLRPLLASFLLISSAVAARAEKCTPIGGNGVTVECVMNQMPIGSNAFSTAQPTAVGTTATLIVGARITRNGVTIENLGTAEVFLGSAGVTATTGFLLPGTRGASVTIPTQGAVYGVVATGTDTVAVLETY